MERFKVEVASDRANNLKTYHITDTTTGRKLRQWYFPEQRSWVLYAIDNDGAQLGESDYSSVKQDAFEFDYVLRGTEVEYAESQEVTT